MFLSEWRKFPSAPCLAGGKKYLMTARVSMLLKSRASLTRFRACFLPGRAKDLSAPRYIFLCLTESRESFDSLFSLHQSVLEMYRYGPVCRFLLNLHTGRSLTQNTIPDAVLTQFDLLMMSTELLEACRGL